MPLKSSAWWHLYREGRETSAAAGRATRTEFPPPVATCHNQRTLLRSLPKSRTGVSAVMEPWRLVALRKACGVTQYWLAAELGLAPCTISALENGRLAISHDRAQRIVAVLRERLPSDAARLLLADALSLASSEVGGPAR